MFRKRSGLGPFCSGLGPVCLTEFLPGPGRLAEQIRTLLNIEIIVLVRAITSTLGDAVSWERAIDDEMPIPIRYERDYSTRVPMSCITWHAI